MRLYSSAMTRLALLCLFAVFAAQTVSLSPAVAASLLAAQEKPDKNAVALQRLLDDIGKQRAEVISIQRELTARPALAPESGGEGEEAKARWIEEWLRQKGFPLVERLDYLDAKVPSGQRPNLVLRLPGQSGRTLWLVCHLHVATPGPLDRWQGSPWTLRVEGDTVYGRGVMDNHQSIAAALLLFENLKRQQITPPMGLGLVLHAQTNGFRHVLAKRPDIFAPDDLLIVPDFGNPKGTSIALAEKGLLWLNICIKGEQKHSGSPQGGHNTLRIGARFIRDMDELAKSLSAAVPMFQAPYVTFEPTMVLPTAGSSNAVPAEFTFSVDCRFTPIYSPADIMKEFRTLADKLEREEGVSINLTETLSYYSPPPTRQDSPVVLAVLRSLAAEGVKDVSFVGINTVSSATPIREKGLAVAEWGKMDDTRRQIANESTTVSASIEEARVFARILFDQEAAKAAPANAGEEKTP
ncbi:Peptidase M20 [uncultured delta proteobacterium]|uniref:Peptidase M20 n=1 Tax=uncultured delta proteobacterium TaxID=34034 RepID=A0A212KFV2_9DELT|nr:Peptidase M20 [uncultured delta proteobacterium]